MALLTDTLATRAWEAIRRIAAAHVSMLADAGILDADGQAALAGALDSVRRGDATTTRLVDLVAAFDQRVEAVSPPGMIGAAAVGRGAAEMVATVIRLLLREDLLRLADELTRLLSSLLDLAGTHAVTIMPVFSGGQAAQPTTFGHLLGGTIGPLGRAHEQVRHAYSAVNQSPMGAGALAATAIEVDRERQADLLGFSGPIDNTVDAVAAVDHLLACANVATHVATPISRFLAELTTWLRTEPGALHLATEWLGHEPGLPQLKPATGLIDLQSQADDAMADADRLRHLAAHAPYAPITPIADRALALSSRCLDGAAALVEQTGALVATGIQIDRAPFANRAGRGFSTVSDLADFLMIEAGLEPASARAIAALTYRRAAEEGLEASGITPEMIDGASLLVIGREVGVEFEAISRYLAPRRFIERRTGTGGPAPQALRDFLDRERGRLADQEAWLAETRRRLDEVFTALDRLAEAGRV